MGLKQNLAKKWAGLRLGHQALMLADAAALLKDNRAQNRAHGQRIQKHGTASTSAADEDMGIHVGDIHHEHHYHGGNQEQTIATKGSSVIKRAAQAAALVGVGVAAPYALPAAAELLKDRPAATSPAEPFTDTDTSVDIELQVEP